MNSPRPWGELLSATGDTALATLNPIRYRGYYYDTETGFYYLQSRYYDPVICRFINADGYVSTGQGMLGFNMFAYCLNNPIMFVDKTGMSPEAVLKQWVSSMWWLIFADAALPVGDIIYWGGVGILGVLTIAVILEINKESEDVAVEVPEIPEVTYPGDDPTKAPEGFEWKGKGEQGSKDGNYYNKKEKISLHPDLDHPAPIGPHWDLKDTNGNKWRLYPNGEV